MIKLGIRVLQLLADRLPGAGTAASTTPELDFSNPANSGYRGYFF